MHHTMPRVLGIVPARAGSKRLPHKNVCLLGNKPLVAWAIEAALNATVLTHLVVSSDSDEILRIAAGYGVEPLRRPDALATDISPAIDYVGHALDAMRLRAELTYEAVVIVQPSSPLTLGSDIDATVRLLMHSGADSAVSVVTLEHALHPAKLKIMRGDRLLPYCEEEVGRFAAHELTNIFIRNGAVYASRMSTIRAGQVIGPDCRGMVMPRERSIDINDWMDLMFARFLIAHRDTHKTNKASD